MQERSSRDFVLKKVRQALLQKNEAEPQQPIDLDSDVFALEEGELIEIFSANFLANKGNFTYCFNRYDFLDQFLYTAQEEGWNQAVCLEQPLQESIKYSGLSVRKD